MRIDPPVSAKGGRWQSQISVANGAVMEKLYDGKAAILRNAHWGLTCGGDLTAIIRPYPAYLGV